MSILENSSRELAAMIHLQIPDAWCQAYRGRNLDPMIHDLPMVYHKDLTSLVHDLEFCHEIATPWYDYFMKLKSSSFAPGDRCICTWPNVVIWTLNKNFPSGFCWEDHQVLPSHPCQAPLVAFLPPNELYGETARTAFGAPAVQRFPRGWQIARKIAPVFLRKVPARGGWGISCPKGHDAAGGNSWIVNNNDREAISPF